MPTELLLPTDDAIAHAAKEVRAGRLVAFPTETVYGLGADATNDSAVASIFEAKGRPAFNPLIVHVKDMTQALRYAHINEAGQLLSTRFWPGGVTLVARRRDDCPLSLLVSAGLDTVALRVPAHPVAQALIAISGCPLAAPSANPSGRLSPTQASHVLEGLGAGLGEAPALTVILDGGPCALGLESTVIGLPEGSAPVLLRPGAVPRGEIEAVLGAPLGEPQAVGQAGGDTEGRSSPGMLASHYAPHAPLRLGACEQRTGELLLGFGAVPCDLNLSPGGDVVEAAANLFAMLHTLDAQADGRSLAVSPIPPEGLGEAINDRLQRAAS